MRERRRRRVEGGPSETSDEENRGEHFCGGGESDATQHEHGDHGTDGDEEARPPAIRQVAEAHLRD